MTQIVHKANKEIVPHIGYLWGYLSCGIETTNYWSYKWKNVTCKRCLKVRKT